MGILRSRRRPDRARIRALEAEVGLTSATDTTIAVIDKELEAGKPKRRELVPVSDLAKLPWKLDPSGGLVTDKPDPPKATKVYPLTVTSSAYCMSATQWSASPNPEVFTVGPGQRWSVYDHDDVRPFEPSPVLLLK